MAFCIGFAFAFARGPLVAMMPLRAGSKRSEVAHQVRCTAAPRNQPSDHQMRRSANYQPSLWDMDALLSLKSEKNDETLLSRFQEWKEMARLKLFCESDLQARLELVNVLQCIGLDYHFNEEIKEFLDNISIKKAKKVLNGYLHATALLFRLLRHHGFQVSQDVFNGFLDNKGSFMGHINENIHGILSLYEASHLSFEGEMILDEAKVFTANHLGYLMARISPNLRENIAHALELPLHWRAPRLEVTRYIKQYKRDDDRDRILLQLAILDFNEVQSIYQAELERMTWWWRTLGLRDKLSFARDRMIECFFFATGVVFEPHLGYCREQLAKVCSLIITIDDIYDIYGKLDELKLLTRAINRWEIPSNEGLPEYMKICYSTLYNTTNEMANEIMGQDGWTALPFLRKVWIDLCNSFLLEAKWYNEGYNPTLEEYLNNGWMSVSGHVILIHTIILSREKVTKEKLQWLGSYPSIIRSSSMIFRLCNDLATSTAELERGDVPTSIQCYMREYGVPEIVAREGIKGLIIEEWKKLNKDAMNCSLLPRSFASAALNLARTAHCIYRNGDGIGAPNQEKIKQMKSLFFEPM